MSTLSSDESDRDEMIQQDLDQIMQLNTVLFQKGNYKLEEAGVNSIVFSNGIYKLDFYYDINRYAIRMFDQVRVEIPSLNQRFDCIHVMRMLSTKEKVDNDFVTATGRKMLSGNIAPTDLASYSLLIEKRLLKTLTSKRLRWVRKMKKYFEENFYISAGYYREEE